MDAVEVVEVALRILLYFMIESHEQIVRSFFTKSCELFHQSWEASRWHSEEDQYCHFALMNRLINWAEPEFSVLDVGCGHGDFYQYAKTRNRNVKYSGIDITPLMVQTAKKRFSQADIQLANLLSDDYNPPKSDYVVAIGTFAIKIQGDQGEYLAKAVAKLFSLAKKGVAITLASDKLELAGVYDELYYYSPMEVLETCLRVTPSVIIDHAALPYEMLVFLHPKD